MQDKNFWIPFFIILVVSLSGLVFKRFANPQSRGIFLVNTPFSELLPLQISPVLAISRRSNVVNSVVEISGTFLLRKPYNQLIFMIPSSLEKLAFLRSILDSL